MLYHLHFDALADRSLRFYLEHFKPEGEREVHKDRRRFHLRLSNTEDTINIERMREPSLTGVFVGFRGRTWRPGY